MLRKLIAAAPAAFTAAATPAAADVAAKSYTVLNPSPPPPSAAARDAYVVLGPPEQPSVTATVPTMLQPRVVIYDGVCHLCHGGVKWVIRADKYKKLKFCCLQSKAAEPYMSLCGVDREDVMRRFLFIEGLDAYYEGSMAALKVASYLPFPYSALSALQVVPGPLREKVYDYVANQRYDWFGKEEECLVLQEQEMLERFIDRDELLRRRED